MTADNSETELQHSIDATVSKPTSARTSDGLRALEQYKVKDSTKVVVRFKAVGNAPIMKQNFYKITSSNRFQAVIQFLRKELVWAANEPLHTYINLAFSPAPDDTVANLYKSFATDGHLIVNYRYSHMSLWPFRYCMLKHFVQSTTQAWG
ncbi:hypothetical protein AMATHDRAFT_46930 [Amanita thiersii Skay4041]|uniref:Ubiquitin-like protein ATG12 n=1 Tax=Amanita thiersii Skay4041 TaxID=703135 RepID=A0A2A9NQH7_9AGAR|nr:hypothetical protein AMATHDRAFT_46930 [Amanita thiersii Skay4041]